MYQCHKKVQAFKIRSIHVWSDEDYKSIDPEMPERVKNGGATVFAEESPSAFILSAEYVKKHNPKTGGYWVMYEDGYQSWSPAEVFESGYSLIEPQSYMLNGLEG